MRLLKRLFGPPDRDAFARLMTDALRRAGIRGDVAYQPADFSLRITGEGGRNVFFMTNAYSDYLAARGRAGRAEVLRRYAGSGVEAQAAQQRDATYDEAKPHLLPRVQSRFYYEAMDFSIRRQGGSQKHFIARRPFAPNLSIDLVYDLPDSIQPITTPQLEEWRVTFDEALSVARENLWSRSNEEFALAAPGLYLGPWEDAQAASRLYLHDLIWQLKVKGEHVAMVPSRGVLLVTGSDDTDALAAMGALADDVLQKDRPLSGVAVRLEGTQWVQFLPPPESPAYWPLKRAALRSAGIDYAEQKGMLETIHEQEGQDVYVASFNVMRRADGTWHSWTSWLDGVTDALMPEADAVCFGRVDPAGSATTEGFAPWGRVAQVLAGLMEPTDHYPPRYRVRQFPAPGQLKDLALTANPPATARG